MYVPFVFIFYYLTYCGCAIFPLVRWTLKDQHALLYDSCLVYTTIHPAQNNLHNLISEKFVKPVI